MRPPWTRRRTADYAAHMSPPERKTINVVPPRETNPDDYPWVPDIDRLKMWKVLAENRLAIMNDLRAQVDRLRADLALARNLAAGPADCGHRATLAHYDALLERCRAEHLDGDEAERLRNAAYPKLEVPW